MAAHTQEQFELFMSQLKETNATLDFYCDFLKIARYVADISISLNMLNYLLGKQNLREAVEALWARDPKVFDVMDILIATRKREKKKFFDELGRFRTIHSLFESVDGVMEFLEGTGLASVFRKPEIKDLVDYVFGVETGLDSNARKNRSGKITEKLVAKMFSNANIEYREQVSSNSFPAVGNALGADQKVFDFVIETAHKTYLIEVNFYSDGGSKLNETARSYTDVAPKVNSIEGFEFVWITDGVGWHKAKNKLQEAFDTIPNIYNLTTINEFINKVKNS
ncbi:MAG: type II restriction endonuclease [Salinivirgaceae bacterium]|nr:type II restriction endonuclease [Salinivirgaceae bacterium]